MAGNDVGTFPMTTKARLDPGVDLVHWLEPGDSIASATADLYDKALGTTANTYLDGVPSVSGTQTVQFVKNPATGKVYVLRFEITTTQGRVETPQVTIPTALF